MKTVWELYSIKIGFVLMILLYQGCSSDTSVSKPVEVEDTLSYVLAGDDEVLVTIDNEKITRYDLEAMIGRTLGSKEIKNISAVTENKILESLVLGRVMANAGLASMDAEEKAMIERDAFAYKEQLLVKKYIRKNATPEPVTQEMIEEYYLNHPERFGARTTRQYEMISGSSKMHAEMRDEILATLEKIKEESNWKKAIGKSNRKKYLLTYSKLSLDRTTLHPNLQTLMKSMVLNQVSNVSFIEGKPYLIRLVSMKSYPPKPLAEVSIDIRKALLPVQLKKSIKQLSEKLIDKVNIQYSKEWARNNFPF